MTWWLGGECNVLVIKPLAKIIKWLPHLGYRPSLSVHGSVNFHSSFHAFVKFLYFTGRKVDIEDRTVNKSFTLWGNESLCQVKPLPWFRVLLTPNPTNRRLRSETKRTKLRPRFRASAKKKSNHHQREHPPNSGDCLWRMQSLSHQVISH